MCPGQFACNMCPGQSACYMCPGQSACYMCPGQSAAMCVHWPLMLANNTLTYIVHLFKEVL